MGVADIAVCKNGATPACSACQTGWQGANCDACVTDQVCKASLGDATATCNSGFEYTKWASHPPPASACVSL